MASNPVSAAYRGIDASPLDTKERTPEINKSGTTIEVMGTTRMFARMPVKETL
jgi:hypothetical protein